MKTLFVLPLFALACLHAAEPTVTLAGVQVVFDDGAKEFGGFRTYNREKGHSVALIVRSEGKAIVDFNDEKASITLGAAKAECDEFFAKFSDDQLAMKIDFTTSKAVKLEADGSLKVAGELPVTLATGKAETRSEAFAPKAGTAVTFASDAKDMPTLKVKSFGKSEFGEGEYEIEFSTNRNLNDYAGMKFYAKDGKPVKAESAGHSWMGGFLGSKGSGTFSYRFKVNPAELMVAVESWTGLEEKTLKVDLSVSLAAPKP